MRTLVYHFEVDPLYDSAAEYVENFLKCDLSIDEMGETDYSGEYRVVLSGTEESFRKLYEVDSEREGGAQSYPCFEEWMGDIGWEDFEEADDEEGGE